MPNLLKKSKGNYSKESVHKMDVCDHRGRRKKHAIAISPEDIRWYGDYGIVTKSIYNDMMLLGYTEDMVSCFKGIIDKNYHTVLPLQWENDQIYPFKENNFVIREKYLGDIVNSKQEVHGHFIKGKVENDAFLVEYCLPGICLPIVMQEEKKMQQSNDTALVYEQGFEQGRKFQKVYMYNVCLNKQVSPNLSCINDFESYTDSQGHKSFVSLSFRNEEVMGVPFQLWTYLDIFGNHSVVWNPLTQTVYPATDDFETIVQEEREKMRQFILTTQETSKKYIHTIKG